MVFQCKMYFFQCKLWGYSAQKNPLLWHQKIEEKHYSQFARFLEHESSWPRTNVWLQEGDTGGSYLGCNRRCWTVIKNRNRTQLLSGRFLRFIISILKKSKKTRTDIYSHCSQFFEKNRTTAAYKTASSLMKKTTGSLKFLKEQKPEGSLIQML